MLGPTLGIYNSIFLLVYLNFVISDPEKRSRNVGLYFAPLLQYFGLPCKEIAGNK